MKAFSDAFKLGPGYNPPVIEGWSEDFSYAFYRKILSVFKSDLSPRRLSDALGGQDPSGKPIAVMRHDVDVCPQIALRMATVEHEEKFASTYLFLTDSPLYKLEDPATGSAMRQIAAMGHEIALHFDIDDGARVMRRGMAEVEEQINVAAQRIAAMSGVAVESLSFHRPLDLETLKADRVAGLVNAYGPSLMRRYLSDSNACWREGNPLQSLSSAKGQALQMLVHPIWWGETHLSRQDRLEQYCEGRDDPAGDLDERMFRGLGLTRVRDVPKHA